LNRFNDLHSFIRHSITEVGLGNLVAAMTRDPIGFADGPNLYAYLHHSPLNSFDAFGLKGEGYRDSCNVNANSSYYNGSSNHYEPMFPIGPDHSSANEERAGYISHGTIHGMIGAFHGSVDFFTHQIYGVSPMLCSIGAHEWDDSDERLFAQVAFSEWQMGHLDSFDDWLIDS
jgi:hypothetical protein